MEREGEVTLGHCSIEKSQSRKGSGGSGGGQRGGGEGQESPCHRNQGGWTVFRRTQLVLRAKTWVTCAVSVNGHMGARLHEVLVKNEGAEPGEEPTPSRKLDEEGRGEREGWH